MSAALATYWDSPPAVLAGYLQQRAAVMRKATVVAIGDRRQRNSFRGFDDFMPALRVARETAAAAAGPRWWMSPDHSIWARVPAAWVHWKGLSISGTSPRDLHFPMGRYWLGGALPMGPEYAAPISVAQFAKPPPRRQLTIVASEWELLADAAD